MVKGGVLFEVRTDFLSIIKTSVGFKGLIIPSYRTILLLKHHEVWQLNSRTDYVRHIFSSMFNESGHLQSSRLLTYLLRMPASLLCLGTTSRKSSWHCCLTALNVLTRIDYFRQMSKTGNMTMSRGAEQASTTMFRSGIWFCRGEASM
jgi:hypothetical protein